MKMLKMRSHGRSREYLLKELNHKQFQPERFTSYVPAYDRLLSLNNHRERINVF